MSVRERARAFAHTLKFPVLAAAIVPALLMFLVLSGYFLYDRTQEVFRNLESQGELLASYLASVSEYGLTSGNVAYLDEVVEGLLRDKQVHSVLVVDKSERVVVSRQRQEERVADHDALLPFEANVYLQQVPSQALSLFEGDGAVDAEALDHRPLLGRAKVMLSTEIAESEKRSVLRYGMTLAVVALILAVYVGISLANRFTQRIEKITQGIRRIRKGDYNQPVEPLRREGTELAVLAEDVNTLAQTLAHAQVQARSHVEALTHARENAETLVAARTRELAAAHDDAVKANLDNQRLIKTMNTLLEQERQHTSREIHDQLNALLVTIRLGLERLQKNIQKMAPPDPRLQETQNQITEILERVTQGYALARGIIHRLRPEVIDALGLRGALEEMIQSYNRLHTSCQFEYTFSLDVPDLGDEANIAIYRIVQEALTNVVKHAHATQVNVSVERQTKNGRDHVSISIEDNGLSFNPQRAVSGIGILSMRERARGLGGELKIMASPQSGTRVHAVIPVMGEGSGNE